ncbi:MAG TPA: hypothetical protein VNG33_08780 [Polyangiaceae bacterium]|nr:hypothetical protein [Polyangiaceae bacterium]
MAPSFLVVASGLACGATSGGADGNASGTAGAASQSSTGAQNSAGSDAVSGTGSGTVGGTGSGGATLNPPIITNPPAPGCPTQVPMNGAPCVGPPFCSYGGGMSPSGCPAPLTSASCMGGAWQVSLSVTNCNPPPTLVCPPTPPAPNTGCFGVNAEGLMCSYPAQGCPSYAWCQTGMWHAEPCPGAGGAGGEPSVGGAAGAGGAP